MIGKTLVRILTIGIVAASPKLVTPAIAAEEPGWSDDTIVSAARIIGADVRGENGETLGRLHDLVLARSGFPMLAVIGTGVADETPGRLVALPFAELRDAGNGEISVGISRQELADRAAFNYEDPSVLALAPLGFGAVEGSPEMTERDDYLNTWAARIEALAERMDERSEKANLTAEYQLDRAWTNLQEEWRNIRSSSRRQWSRAAESFEAAVDAFETMWQSENGGQAASGAD